ncbi:ABC transporter substrate-binding protein [uncultured Desulfobacter sp.]|uniref:ABC transporter substrate-binding protein n=1 Tax=uncultured Desulfobacter sp. TaxID=240139 RepID=UPI002AA6E363|nr:ABC transporter substrate-binding protein [uncultured Desulfobacter sp.]
MKKTSALILIILGLTCSGTASVQPVLTETDGQGHVLSLDRHPERIACLYAFTGHVTAMLGRGSDMVAIVKGLKKDKLLGKIVPHLSSLPVPSAGGVIHIESLIKTRPDIVFLKPETESIAQEVEKLKQFGLPYFSAAYSDMQSQMSVIEAMGRILNKEKKALDYTRYYRQAIARVKDKTDRIADADKLSVYHAINEPFRTDGPGTLEADWTGACNILNVSVGKGLIEKNRNKRFAGMEQILMWDPAMIIANEAQTAQKILSDPQWAPIKAVKKGRVFTIPVGISRWGHPGGLETPLAILWTAKTAYPDLFTDLDLKTEVRQFYQRFFDLGLDDPTIKRILSGQGMRTTHINNPGR